MLALDTNHVIFTLVESQNVLLIMAIPIKTMTKTQIQKCIVNNDRSW